MTQAIDRAAGPDPWAGREPLQGWRSFDTFWNYVILNYGLFQKQTPEQCVEYWYKYFIKSSSEIDCRPRDLAAVADRSKRIENRNKFHGFLREIPESPMDRVETVQAPGDVFRSPGQQENP